MDGHDQAIQTMNTLIGELAVEQRRSREDSHRQQEITRRDLGEKVDNVANETAAAKTEVAILREVATSTRGDLRSLKRVVTGGVGTLILTIILDRLTG